MAYGRMAYGLMQEQRNGSPPRPGFELELEATQRIAATLGGGRRGLGDLESVSLPGACESEAGRDVCCAPVALEWREARGERAS